MVKVAKEVISYNLGRNILFDKVNYGENILILYQNTINSQQMFKNTIKQMTNDDTFLFHISHNSNKLNYNSKIQNFNFNVINEEVIHKLKSQLDNCFQKREKENKRMVLLSDWSKANLNDCSIFFPFLEELIKKSQDPSPAGWKRKYKNKIKIKTPVLLLNAFETSNLRDDFIQQLISLHQRVYLLQENTNTFLLPSFSPSVETIFPKSHVLPQELLEKVVKDNLELITLLFLEKMPQSGYQILKNIAQHFHCILSQGTLYPLLYKLEKKNEINKQNGNGREVIYSLTSQTQKDLQSKKEVQLSAYQHLASFFEGGKGNQKSNPQNLKIKLSKEQNG